MIIRSIIARGLVSVPLGVLMSLPLDVLGWVPLATTNDLLIRMPGTQPGAVTLESIKSCNNCHYGYGYEEPSSNWMGSMMAQSARDPLFWATVVVAAQDSVWALGNPNAADLCMRCHFPQGWLEGRSDPVNAIRMTGHDYDGVHCTVCHSMMDPFFADTFAGTREGADWTGYWDETGSLPQTEAHKTYVDDALIASVLSYMNNMGFYTNDRPASSAYIENAGGQMFINVSGNKSKRASFADANANHEITYSRYHKSRYFCSTCHDVSNPVLVNLGADPNQPLPSEMQSAFSYAHVERTFSEFMLSAFGQQNGAPGTGAFAPETLITSQANNWITSCQDCHMRDGVGRGCDKKSGVLRPTSSVNHPKSGVPIHDMTGGNAWIPRILASTVSESPNYDPVNRDLLVTPGPAVLTVDFSQGLGLNPRALIAGAERAEIKLQQAATLTNLNYNPYTGEASFRIVNHTGHKLISGYPEGRRLFANIVLVGEGQILHEVNPYDLTAGTLKGLDLDYSPNSPALASHEIHLDELVYEAKMSSELTGEQTTFHFALATSRYKDNRIPPRGFRYEEAGTRLSEPVWQGVSATNLFSPAEYEGGYRDVHMTLPAGATQMTVRLFYQTTSREYIEFLRDEINGTGTTLTGTGAGGDPPYLAQTDPWFAQLRAWGDTIWELWDHNKNLPGAAPVQMAEAVMAWQWKTQVHLSVSIEGQGWVEDGDIWYDLDDYAVLHAVASPYYEWSHWSGDIPVGQVLSNPVALLMDGPKAVSAVFLERLATNNVPEWWIAHFYPDVDDMDQAALSDTDGDGVPAWAEYIAGTNPTDFDSVFVVKAMDSGVDVVRWSSEPGRRYSVFYSTNLLGDFRGFDDGFLLPATPSLNLYTNRSMTNQPALFYRIDVLRE